jgi:bacterioferritin-associated ferredoxin
MTGRMVVCICNRLTDTMIAAAVADGARNQADVFRRFRLKRGCSSCSVRIAQAIERALKGPGLEAAE